MRMRKKKNCAERMERCSEIWIKNPQEYKGKWGELFKNGNPIHIEIGCGKGNFVVGMAKKYPDINFIAIEKVEDVIVMAMEKAVAAELENVLFTDMDAERIEDFFEYGEIERIYLNFSDPWKKNKQAKRRLTHKNFLDKYKKVLRCGDYIWFKTDNRKLFEFSLNSFAQENFKLENITLDLHNSDFEDNVVTEYEQRFLDEGMPIYRLEAVNLGWEDNRKIKGGLKMFNANKVKDECVEWIRDFFDKNGKGCNAVVGISGGKDSSVTAALCAEALGKERVIGVLMPCGEQSDIDCSHLLVNHLGIKNYTINVKDAIDGILNQFPKDLEIIPQTRINLPPRIRMAAVYAVSQSCNGRVANTCNLSEDWVGYATRYGDGAGDFSPLSMLTVTEVKAIGRILGLPEELVEKPPVDGLCGKTDEDNLGFTYAVLDRYIRTGEIDDEKTKARIDEMHRNNLFKLQLMPHFEPEI